LQSDRATFVDLLRARASETPGRTACVFLPDGEVEQARLTYAELDARARTIAAALQRRGAAGERALLLYPPGLDFVAAFFGCFYAGAVAVPAYPPRSGREQPRLRSILEDAKPSFALAPAPVAARLDDLAAELPGLEQAERLMTDDLPLSLAEEWEEPCLGPADLAFLQYTSGSTSEPKGVMVSHGNLMANEEAIRAACDHDERSTFVSWLPIYHDMGLIGAVLQPLYVGAFCVLMPPLAFLQQPVRWLRAISRYRACTSGAPDFAYELCARKIPPEQREGLDLSSWRIAFNGAEPVRAGTLERFAAAFAPHGFRPEAFFPCYGLAEATLLVTGEAGSAPDVRAFQGLDGERPVAVEESAERARRLVSCGPPRQEVAIADPETGAERAAGEVGEIWVSGPSVAHGYWGRPEESEKTFHARLAGRPGPGFLRTGDLGFLLDGRLFVTGRLKDLILVRGRNLYPQDLELTVQTSHPALAGVGAAFAVEEGEAERVVAVQEIDPRRVSEAGEALESARRAVAEEHEAALHALVLVRPGAVPRTTSGKVQRRLCRRMFLEGSLEPVAEWRAEEPGPREAAALPPLPDLPEIETWLAEVLARRLGTSASRVDLDAPLVRQGLDSLAAVELAHEVEAGLGVALPFAELLEAASLRAVAALVLGGGRARPESSAVRESGDVFPLSPGQRGLWLVQKLDPASPENTVAGAALLSDVDPEAIRRAFATLADRHAALRTTFHEEGGEPVQRVHPRLDPDFAVLDAASWTDWTDEIFRPFDLEGGPLLRVRLFRRPTGFVLLLAAHHLVTDLWSMAVLLRDLGAVLSGAPLAPGGTSFAEHARHEAEAWAAPRDPEVWSYWERRLGGDAAPLDLPVDRPRPDRPRHRAGARLFDLFDQEEPLRALGAERGATLFVSLLALFQAFLHRVTGQDRVRVASPLAGRPSRALADGVGYFVNPVVLASEAEDDPAFADLLSRVRRDALEAFRHEVPFPLLVERLRPRRDAARPPLAQAAFSLQRAPLGMESLPAFALGLPGARLDLGGLTLESLALPERPAQFDLTLLVAEVDGRLRAALLYDEDLFDPATAARMAGWLRNLARGLSGTARLSDLPLLDEAERRQVLGGQITPRSAGEPVLERIAAQARRRPQAPAVLGPGGRGLTYADLVRRAHGLAWRLRSVGVGTESRVAVLGERRPETIAGLLAVLEAGAAYLPLDPAHPPGRNAWAIEDAGATTLDLDGDVEERSEAPDVDSAPENAAYVIYTSGSTGRPKGVVVSRGALLDLVDWHVAAAGLGPEDRVSHLAGPAFDASVWEIWPALAAGAALCLPEEEVRSSPERLRDWLVAERVTVAFVPTALAEPLLALEWPMGTALRLLLTGGDRLRVRPPAGLPFAVRNNYGPTEAAVVATSGPVAEEEPGLPDIGRPRPGTRVVLLDRRLQPVPPGLPGELCLAGPSLARGYLRRPDLTAERFLPDPFAAAPGERMYRTGDRARLRPDGALDFLGRVDDQVQVRGVRVEPAEVEAALALHPSVRAAVVLPVGDPARLAAFVEGSAPAGELRAFLAERLPAALVPSLFVPVEALPLTANGKVDRKALAGMAERASGAAAPDSPASAPRDPVEELLARLWADALGTLPGIHDDLFALGGHSLLAARIAARAGEAFGVELALRDVFEAPTVAGLAARVRRAAGDLAAERVRRVPRSPEPPLSFGQEGLWIFERLRPGTAAYHVPLALELSGPLDVSRLEAALAGLEERHEALRTALPEVDGRPVQRVHPPTPPAAFRLPLTDLSSCPNPLAEAERQETDEARRPFDLEQGSLWRAALLRLAPDRHRLILTLHHAICDGASLEVLLRDLGALLAGSALPQLDIQPADWAAWQRRIVEEGGMEPRLAAWERRLAGAPALQLVTDRPRPAALSLRGFTRSLELPAAPAGDVDALARAERATPFLVLLAAFQALLHRYTGQTDLVVGSPVSRRDRPELEPLVGLFVNLVALRARVAPEAGFRELLRQVREDALEAFALADVPFERVVERVRPERGLSHGPLFQATVALDPGAPGFLALPGLTAETRAVDTGTAKLDLGLALRSEPGRLTATLELSADLFDEATGERMLAGLARLLAAAAAAPDRPVAELPLLGEAERRQLLVEWNDRPVPAGAVPRACLHELFAARAARTPDAVAVAHEGEALSYRDLDDRSRRLAGRLVAEGLRPGTPVAVWAARSAETIVGLLAALRAGGVYLPLDPSYPPERLRGMLRDSGAPVLLAKDGDRLPEELPEGGVRRLSLAAPADARSGPLPSLPPEAPAYLLYTSGSTGRPKGVVCHHAAVLGLLADLDARAPLAEGTACSLWTSFSFDVSIYEIASALLSGGRLEIVPDRLRSDGRALAGWMAERRIGSAYVAPSMLGDLLEALERGAEIPLRRLLVGVEPIPEALLAALAARVPGLAIVNGYGPTETTVCATLHTVGESPAREGRTPIGRPVRGSRVYLLDRAGEPVPPGVPGELHAAGAGLALGYWGRPDLTAERFLPDPFGGLGERMYRTGDLARLLASGELEFLGRVDRQLKIRGFRVEPDEVETALREHPDVRDAAVGVRPGPDGELRLVAWVAGGVGDGDGDLKAFLRGRLPEFMIPAAVVPLDALPVTANGKLDRAALPDPDWRRPDLAEGYAAPRTATEAALAEIWAGVLGVEHVGVHDDFFALGGHSLAAGRLAARVRADLDADLPVRAVFEAPTVAELAALVDARRGETSGRTRIPRGPETGPFPLSYAQQQIWIQERLAPGSPAFHLPAALDCEGELDVASLASALREIVRRHEALRARIVLTEDGPVQTLGSAEASLPAIDLSALPAAARAAEAGRLSAEEARRPFDLERGPLLRSSLLRLAPDRHRLLLTVHHLAADALSVGLLLRELGQPPAGPPALRYVDFALWQREHLRGETLAALLDHWTGQLRGLPPLELPADRPRPAVPSHRGGRRPVRLDDADALRAAGRAEEATLFMVLLAGFQAVLGRHAGQDDVAVGTAVANRPDPALEGTVGLFLETLVLRTGLAGDPTFRQLLARVRETVLAALAHQELPFQRLVESLQPERELARGPLFQVFFGLRGGPEPMPEILGVQAALAERWTGATQLDLSLSLEEEGLTGWLEHDADLFDAPTAERLAGHLRTFLAAAVAEPDRRLADLPLLSEAERGQILREWNDTAADGEEAVCIHEAFAERAARTPDAVAAVWRHESWTYRELAAAAGSVARQLRRLGVRPGDRVGVCLDRSLPLLSALLGVMEAGAAYVPLDPSYPAARLAGMLEDAEAAALVTRPGLEGRPDHPVVLFLDGSIPGPPSLPSLSSLSSLPPDTSAYLLYTSGSTGTPKGVAVSHRNVANFFAAMDEVLAASRPEAWLAVTSVSFDISVLELLWSLTRGVRVVIQEEGIRSLGRRPSPARSSGRPLDFSLFYFADAGGDQEDKYRLLLEGARFADRHGFKAVWTPERHFHSFGGLYPNPSVTGAAVAAVTERVEVRAGSVVLPLHDPLRVAEEWSVVDNLSRGRVAVSFASGWHADDFVLAPERYAERKEEMLRGVETVRRLWRGEAVRRRGGSGAEVEVRIEPRPVQPELPVWLTAAGNEETFRLAGETGAGILTHLLGQTLEEVAEKVAVYREAWRRTQPFSPTSPGGRAGTVTLMLHTFVGDDLEAVRETVRAPFTRYLRSSLGLVRNLARSLGLGDDLDRLPPADLDLLLAHAFDRYFETSALFGTVESCRGQIERLRDAGVDEVACLIDFGVGFDAALAGLQRLAELRDRTAERTAEEAAAAAEDFSLPAQIARHGVTHLQCTPSMAGLLAADAASFAALGSLRALLVGGEALPADLARTLRTALAPGGGELWNLYGPTETTVWSLAQRVEDEEPVPIGRPIRNTAIRLLDRDLRPVPVGVPGEVFLGGDGVAAGYRRRPALTAERFLPDPFDGRPGDRLYRTGDLARFRPDGRLDFLGRLDHQVKVRGHRIEPGEIEAALRSHPAVQDAVVVARPDAPGGSGAVGLVAYVVPVAGAAAPEPLRPRREAPADRHLFELPNGLAVATLSDFQASTGYREVFEDETYLRHGVTLPDGACIFDVGANIGFFTLWAHGRCRNPRIYAFEPLPPTFETLRANVDLYGLDVRLFPCGVADRPGRAAFTFYRNAPGLSGRFAGTAEDREETRAIVLDWLEKAGPAGGLPAGQLDEVLDEHLRGEVFDCELVTLSDVIRQEGIERIDLLKVDVERSELDVLRGIRDEDWPRIDQVVLEIHSRELLERVSALLAGRGYELAVEDVAVVEGGEDRPAVQVHMLYAVSPRVRERSGSAGSTGSTTSAAGPSAGELRRWLAERLPEAMIPAAFVPLEALPLTGSGKVDRRALPAPDAAARPRLEAAYVAPRTRAEEAVAAVWRELLARDRVGIHDNFFEAGGSSLLLVQLQARLREALGRDLTMVEIFRNPTIHGLARLAAPPDTEPAAEAPPAAEPIRASRAEPPAAPDTGGVLDRQRRFLEERKQRKSQRRTGI
jgi:natural product biosynthesis luciferase-like monooxygenase protein/amino acid adenylation domain-containing protein/FkbM family methyltransferase